MSTDSIIRMPQLGLTMTEGLIVEWLANPGQNVTAGEVLFVVETDKIANEVVADRDGVFGQAIVPAGETVPVGTVIGEWAGGNAAAAAASAPAAVAPAPASAPVVTTSAPGAPGDRIKADEALALGLINHVVAPDQLVAKVTEIAQKIAQKSSVVLKLLKRSMAHGIDMPMPAALQYEQAIIGLVLDSKDAHEGCQAFLQKRAAKFTGE